MKKFSLCIFLLISLITFAQSPKPRFHAGISAGLSKILDTSPKTESGLNLNFINAGYSIIKGFGVTGKWVGGKHETDTYIYVTMDNNTYSYPSIHKTKYQGILVGPMYSFNLSKALILDIKALIGRLVSEHKYITSAPINLSSKTTSLGYLSGIALRYNLTNYLYLSAHADYITGNDGFYYNTNQRINIINLNAGFGVRF